MLKGRRAVAYTPRSVASTVCGECDRAETSDDLTHR